MNSPNPRPTRYRFWVLAVLCSLAFLTYLDRICIMRVQGDIERDLRLTQLTRADELSLREAVADPQARLRAEASNFDRSEQTASAAQARAKLANDRATER